MAFDSKVVSTHRGVQIFKESVEIPGSSLRELKDGSMKDCAPKFEHTYAYYAGHPMETAKAVKRMIDELWEKNQNIGTQEDFAWVMNNL